MRRGLLAIVLASVLVACTNSDDTVTGAVIAVEGDLSTVTSFSLVAENKEWTFQPDPEGVFAFPLPHLRDHLRDGTPVRVTYRQSGDGSLLAVGITDG